MNKETIKEVKIGNEVEQENLDNKLDKALEEQRKMQNLVDLFMLALLLIFAIYAIF